MQRARSKDQTPKQVYSTRIIKYNVVLEWMSSYTSQIINSHFYFEKLHISKKD
jgi:hypothetical protein